MRKVNKRRKVNKKQIVFLGIYNRRDVRITLFYTKPWTNHQLQQVTWQTNRVLFQILKHIKMILQAQVQKQFVQNRRQRQKGGGSTEVVVCNRKMFGINFGLKSNRYQVISRLLTTTRAARSFGSVPEQGQESMAIIDALYLVYRVHYGFRETRLTAGSQDTTIIHGFFYNILSMLKAVDPLPSHVAVVMEGNGAQFRKEIYPEYKANRPPTPNEIVEGLDVIPKVCSSVGLRCVSARGYEGDDVVGTLALLARKRNLKTYIISKDKDFKQLLSPNMIILKPPGRNMRKEYTQYSLSDYEEESGGLTPEQWVDVMALAGDASDNISGIDGIGEKTAVKLIQTHGSLENLFENLDKVSGKIRRKTLQAEGSKELAFTCKQLIQLRTDISNKEMGITDLDDFRFQPPKDGGNAAIEFFKQFELRGVHSGFKQLWGLYQTVS
eukprot:TRINITY_DN28370_c1_g1_i5.p1 TRINITY_DN28370_c1_g1~~TRINITY_DN28370_c1_g1_i5.p1  ORF type:complete len:439 (-),score=31.34 TRINITY_DN28370_c1_g1_i5:208-1524(-)